PTAPTRVVTEAPAPVVAGPVSPPKAAGNVNRVDPNDYPPVSRRLTEQGTVMVKVTVTATGSVANFELVKTSGFPRLDTAACVLVKNKFRYVPAQQDGKPVEGTVLQPVTFKLT